MEELETIVSAMEEDSLPLEDLIAHYERGAKLVTECEETLKSARKRLDTIKAQGQGSASKKPVAKTNTEDNNDDEIRLF